MATVTLEKLTCAFGKTHTWTREPTRGRKPTFCPKHREVSSPVRLPASDNGMRTLHCAAGNHDWQRPAQRGRTPENCPKHTPEKGVRVAGNSRVTTQPNGMIVLHCETGNHDWERAPARGRKPANCPEHSGPIRDNLAPNEVLLSEESDGSAMVLILDEEFVKTLPQPEPKRRGRKPSGLTAEQREEASLQKSRERVDELELSLKARGTHLSQQAPYILYKQIGETTARGKSTWERVAEHSPLQRERFLNEHEADFLAKRFRYEREGVVVRNDGE
jgi:hypothetical protein